jgi:hypothetical protein
VACLRLGNVTDDAPAEHQTFVKQTPYR